MRIWIIFFLICLFNCNHKSNLKIIDDINTNRNFRINIGDTLAKGVHSGSIVFYGKINDSLKIIAERDLRVLFACVGVDKKVDSERELQKKLCDSFTSTTTKIVDTILIPFSIEVKNIGNNKLFGTISDIIFIYDSIDSTKARMIEYNTFFTKEIYVPPASPRVR